MIHICIALTGRNNKCAWIWSTTRHLSLKRSTASQQQQNENCKNGEDSTNILYLLGIWMWILFICIQIRNFYSADPYPDPGANRDQEEKKLRYIFILFQLPVPVLVDTLT